MNARNIFLKAARLHQTGGAAQAVPLYRAALKLDPALGDAALYLGLALRQNGETENAIAAFRDAVRLLPGDADALNGLGAALLDQGETAQAEECHRQVLALQPHNAEAMAGLGNAHLAQGKTDAAILRFEAALALNPDSPEVLGNLGVALKVAGHPGQAVSRFEAALALAPGDADTLYNLGNAWQVLGDMRKALACYRAAQSAAPEAVAPRWGACFAHLDVLYDTEEDIARARAAYANALGKLDAFLSEDSPALLREAAASVGANQPFYLTYQGGNDRELQAVYGNMVHRIMGAAFPEFGSPQFAPRTRNKIRVGIATGFLHEHSVWKIPTRGWVRHLDRDRFEVFGYYTGHKHDHCTEEAYRLFDKVTHEPNRFEALCRAMFDDELDVLIYPDVGMDPTCARLAGLRLAPIQCVSLGHPMTTGLPTMDYYLSSELMEPKDGQEAYTENLVRLPNLSVHYKPLRQGPPAYGRDHFGLPEEALLYFCPQSLYKYLPQYDVLFPRIARQIPEARFVFLRNAQAEKLNRRFLDRVHRAFEVHGLHGQDHVIMLPRQPPDAYHALNCLCDVFLDSIEWSGFNTAMEAASAGLPLAIHPKGHMRGRHSLAVAARLGLTEVVAETFDEYVELAVRLGRDNAFRQSVRERVEAGGERLFGDMAAIRGLEEFILRVVR
ncbi:tetratricopeptide repeat protein [Pseudodesulfovibrio cashew]|nr:tetratricopeptide repeat protein [Pseudodesulfovibrio cashew]